MPDTKVDELHDFGYDDDESELAKTWAVLRKLISQYASKKKQAFYETVRALTPQMLLNVINYLLDPSRPVPKWRRRGLIQGLGHALFNDKDYQQQKKKKKKKSKHVHHRDLTKTVTFKETPVQSKQTEEAEEKVAKIESLMGQLAMLKAEMGNLKQASSNSPYTPSTANKDSITYEPTTTTSSSGNSHTDTMEGLPPPPPPPPAARASRKLQLSDLPPPPPPPSAPTAPSMNNTTRPGAFAGPPSSLLADIKKPHQLKKPRRSILKKSKENEDGNMNGGGGAGDGDFLQTALKKKFRSFQRTSSEDSLASPITPSRRASSGWNVMMRQDSAPKLRSRRSSRGIPPSNSTSARSSAATDVSDWQ